MPLHAGDRGQATIRLATIGLCLLAAACSSADLARPPVEEKPGGAQTTGDEAPSSGGASAQLVALVQGSDERYSVPVTKEQPMQGPADALVTIVAFSDFECPFCGRAAPTLARLIATYGDRVRVVWRNQPLAFHKDARPAATLAMEAFAQGGDDAFWRVHDLLFANQRDLDREDLLRYAGQAKLDVGKVRAALDEERHEAAIDEDIRLADQLGVEGTPSFFINGRPISGARPYEVFAAYVNDELARVERLLAAGTPKAAIYTTLTANRPTTKEEVRPRRKAARREVPRTILDPAAIYKVALTGKEPNRGPADALVTIVEFSDFQCPFCGRVRPTIDRILDRYGKEVRLVWMNNPLPFHDNARDAATAALAAFEDGGNEAFWAYHDLLFENQDALTRDDLLHYAKKLKLNVKKIASALDNDRFAAVIDAQQALARELGASGTPGFFINGRNVQGAKPLTAFTAIIDEELARAKALVRGGTPRKKVYERAIAEGKTSPQLIINPSPDAQLPTYAIADAKDAPSKGGKKAKVVIQLFSDFQCPFCRRVLPTLGQIEKHYGEKVRIVWRNYPLAFHKDAALAAQAAMEVHAQGGNKKFWAYHDLLFANQDALSRVDLEQYARRVGGIDLKKFQEALDAGTHAAAIRADMDAVEASGARIGTPAFFINGTLVMGAQPFEAFKVEIDHMLAEAK